MRQKPGLVVIMVILLFTLFFSASNWFRQANLHTSQFDMGNMDQTMWHTVHGAVFQMTSPLYPFHQLRTAVHADYLLLIYAPFYWLWQDPRTMLILQVIFVATGAIPLYWLARKKVGAWTGVALVVAYLFYPTLDWAVTFDVHAVVLVVPLLLWAWWGATEKKWWIYYLAAGLALLGKEEVGFTVAAMGIYWGWRRGYRTMGILSITVGVGWTLLMLGWAIPSARNVAGHFALDYYSEYGSTFSEIAKNILVRPWDVARGMFNLDAILLYRSLFAPVVGLAIIGLPALLVALPEVAINLLSNNVNQHTIFFQYMSVIIPIVFISTIDGIARLRSWMVRHPTQFTPHRKKVLTWFAVLLGAFAIWVWSPIPGSRHTKDGLAPFVASPYKVDVQRVRKMLKADDKVVATNNIVPQFSQRDWIWAFPHDLDKADAIVVLEGGGFEPYPAEGIAYMVEKLRLDPEWKVEYQHDEFWYFRRTSQRRF